MCNLMGNWLKASGLDDAGVNNMVDDHIKSIITEVFDPKKADTIFSDQQVNLFLTLIFIFDYLFVFFFFFF